MLFNQQQKYGLFRHAFVAAILMAATCMPLPAAASISADSSSAVIFLYTRVGEDSLPQSSISIEKFKSHINELKTAGYNVLPLPQVISALKKKEALPHKSVVLTFEGAWTSTFANALPLLDDAQMPYTIFFSSDMADTAGPGHAGWKELRSLQKNKRATLAILPSAYASMIDRTAEQNAALINKAVSRFREELGTQPPFFAYPYGEYSQNLKKQMDNYAFDAIFSQQSGVAHSQSDFKALPRFTMTDSFGDLDRFLLTANALPLPVSDVIPSDMTIDQNPPMIGFTVTPEIKDLSRISCFVSGQGKTPLSRLGGGRIEIRLDQPFEDRATRINCTIPDDTVIPGEPQSWRWFGLQLIDRNFHDDADAGDAEAAINNGSALPQ